MDAMRIGDRTIEDSDRAVAKGECGVPIDELGGNDEGFKRKALNGWHAALLGSGSGRGKRPERCSQCQPSVSPDCSIHFCIAGVLASSSDFTLR